MCAPRGEGASINTADLDQGLRARFEFTHVCQRALGVPGPRSAACVGATGVGRMWTCSLSQPRARRRWRPVCIRACACVSLPTLSMLGRRAVWAFPHRRDVWGLHLLTASRNEGRRAPPHRTVSCRVAVSVMLLHPPASVPAPKKATLACSDGRPRYAQRRLSVRRPPPPLVAAARGVWYAPPPFRQRLHLYAPGCPPPPPRPADGVTRRGAPRRYGARYVEVWPTRVTVPVCLWGTRHTLVCGGLFGRARIPASLTRRVSGGTPVLA